METRNSLDMALESAPSYNPPVISGISCKLWCENYWFLVVVVVVVVESNRIACLAMIRERSPLLFRIIRAVNKRGKWNFFSRKSRENLCCVRTMIKQYGCPEGDWLNPHNLSARRSCWLFRAVAAAVAAEMATHTQWPTSERNNLSISYLREVNL